MQSPRAEWLLGIGHLAVLDYLRARGEPDHDTLSEVTRELVAAHPHGRRLFAATLAAGALVFYKHIFDPLEDTHAR